MRRAAGLLLAPIVASLISTVAFAGPVRAGDVKLGTLVPDGSPWYNIIRDMGEDWKSGTGGKVTLKIWPGGISGDEPDMVRKMRVDQLQAAVLSGVGLSDIVQDVQAMQMPMMLRSYDEFDYVMERMAPRFEAALEAKGFKVLNWGDAGWVQLFAQKPVVRPEDLQALKLFVWGGQDAWIEAYKDAGYHPVPLAATDMMTGLQSGLINAFAAPPLVALSYQWFGLARHMTDLKWTPLVGATMITTRKWRAIPDDLKPLLLDSARHAAARLRETRTLGDGAIEEMKKHGLVIHEVPPEIVAQWEKNVLAAYPKLVGHVVPADAVVEVRRLRDEYRASRQPR